MIKCSVNKHDHNEKASVEADGTIEEIIDDIGNITHTLYFHLMEQGPELAEAFKEAFMLVFADDGPAWMTHEELMKED